MATPAPVLPKPRPYRRFLTSLFHTRFVHAALVSLILSWDNAIFLGPKKELLWWWFPLGPAGLKTLVFFIANLFIFLLQISTLGVGRPTSASPISRLRSLLFSTNTFWTFVGYLLSAFFFSEAYIYTTSNLTWITKGDNGRQDILNEKPIYLRTFYFVLAIAHAFRHLYYSHSTLHLPVSPAPTPQTTDSRTHPVADKYTQLKKQIPNTILRCIVLTVVVSVLAPFVYSIFLRQSMWKAHLGFAKLIFNLQRSNARVTGLPPIFGTMHVTIFTGFFIGFTWEVCSLLFIVYLRKEPIKKDLPLSAASKDPNGTLLNGLKAKRDIVKTYAFWELAIIAQGNPDRRKAIFTDIERPAGPAEVKKTTTITESERPKGPIWAQMLEEALKVLKQADDRISPPSSAPIKPHEKVPDIENLPKILPKAKTGDVFASPTPPQGARMKIAGVLREEAGKLISSPEPWRPQLDKAVKMIEDSQLADARSAISKEVRRSPAAWFFRSTNAARINATVLGSPYGNAAILVDAIEAVTRMLVASLQEDLYGNAIKGVPATVKQFTTSIILIETLIKANPPGKGDIGEVEIVLGRLKAGLRELLAAFQTFLNDTALGIGELNAAKRASGQTSIESQKEKSSLQLKDAPLPSGGNADRQGGVGRSWGKQTARTDHPRLQSGEAPARLFTRQEPAPRKTSRETNGGGRTIRVPPRRREMEQVR